MSLKGFHLLFIALSIVLAVVMAAWAFGQYTSGRGGTGHLVTAGASVAVAAGLAGYARSFRRKARRIGLD